MDLFHEITKMQLVTPSLCDIIFGGNESSRKKLFYPTRGHPKVLYNVCLFYSALSQAYFISYAQSSSLPLNNVIRPDDAYKAILNMWNKEYDFDYTHNKEVVFSLLTCFTEVNNQNVFSNESRKYISIARDAYRKYEKNYKARNLISKNDFLSLIDSFRLLRYVEIDRNSGIITFNIPGANQFSVKYQPFLFFIDNETKRMDNIHGHPYILTNVMKGARNNELRFAVVELNSYNITPRIEILTEEINENIRLICDILKIPTQWHSVSEYMGDYLFIQKLTDAAKIVMVNLLEEKHRKIYNESEDDIFPDILEMFHNTDIYTEIKNHNPVHTKNIDKFLTGLFIKFGVFKTMWYLLFDSEDHTGKDMFHAFLNTFYDTGIISLSKRDEYIAECSKSIEVHINKLEKITLVGTQYFFHRKKEIRAEWYVFYILKAAGIKNEKLFANVESMLSIDDYFDMIKNPHITKEQGLKSVLSFLISFYSPLVRENIKFNQDYYTLEVEKIKIELSSKCLSILELFDKFISIVKSSRKNELIIKLLGRDQICEVRNLERYKTEFGGIDLIKKTQVQNIVSKKQLFISYAHENKDRVHVIVNQLKENNYNIYFDEDKFEVGDDWKVLAMRAIESDDCIGVIAFMSEAAGASKYVEFELSHAVKFNKKIFPINLENRNITDYLDDKRRSNDSNISSVAEELMKLLPKNIIFLNDDPFLIEKLTKRFEKVIKEEGYILDPYSLNEKCDLEIANFYTFLKTGKNIYYKTSREVVEAFEKGELSNCIFPFIVSVKETRIKRDDITLLGYEIIKGKGRGRYSGNYILSSEKLSTDDYYCIPNYRQLVGENCSWMIDPFLVSYKCLESQIDKDGL